MKKTKTPDTPQTLDDVERLLGELALKDARRRALTAKMDAELKAVRDRYAADLDGFLHTQADPALQHAYRFDAAEGTVRQLYSAFRREIRFKGFRYALQQACLAGHNEMVHHLVAPYRSWNGTKQACRTLPPTKLAFACLLHLAHLTGIRIRHQTPQ